ncbi:putative membrane protein SirB2 [Mariprofundus ferrinatatus]|uniref:Putative membrane protein SirB2 n=1 Tax=Mariprofundus ferrinatatus TaxID=1921087 RepID=A0A2K8L5K0_9PROT|nr:SirB2 family protein [Mariprofundus ferrinatatus]ATX81519.1 putative membrane protein SirB2 [Mariprofundus ferrinatatus]
MISVLFPVHTGCALISISLFVWRGVMMWIGRPLKVRFFRRTLPDSVDTVFLFSGIGMAFILGISPLDSHWLAAKIGGLLAYILLGAVALKYGRRRVVKRSCFVAALCVFAYVVAVARTTNAMPWQGWF